MMFQKVQGQTEQRSTQNALSETVVRKTHFACSACLLLREKTAARNTLAASSSTGVRVVLS